MTPRRIYPAIDRARQSPLACLPGLSEQQFAPEPDVWLPAELDLEPEQCWCLRCGEKLPCTTCLSETHQPR